MSQRLQGYNNNGNRTRILHKIITKSTICVNLVQLKIKMHTLIILISKVMCNVLTIKN